MDKNLQRIVGVLIVLALAVVLSPLLFSKGDGSSPPIITTVAQSSTEQLL
jgi:cell division septation protein DedD